MIRLVLLQLAMFRNRVRTMTLLSECKAALMLFIGCLFLGAIYFGAWRFLYYLNAVAVAGPLLVNKLVALVFLTSFSMVVFSSLIASFSTIYFGTDLPWLMSSPLSVRSVFAFKAFSTSFYASWMVLVVLVPFILALGRVKGAAPSFYLWNAVFLVPFLAIASLAGIAASLLLMRIFPSRRTRDILLFLGLLLMTGLYILARLLEPERLVRPEGLEVVAQYLNYLSAPTAVYLPSWWVTAGILGALAGGSREATLYLTLLCGAVFLMLALVVGLAERLYYSGWAEGQICHRRRTPGRREFRRRGAFMAMLRKDFTVFFRDAGQWSQLMVLGALVFVYLFSIHKLPLDTMYLQNLVGFLNVGLIGFILATAALRFVFPSVSLEGTQLWLLRSSPLGASRLLGEKLVFGMLPVVGMGIVMGVVSGLLLRTDWQIFWLTLAAIAVIGGTLSAMAAGFGAMFPRFGMTNVAQIQTSAGGLFYIVSAMFYLLVSVGLLAAPVQNFYRSKFGLPCVPWKEFWWAAAGIVVINILAAGLPLWLGRKSLEELET